MRRCPADQAGAVGKAAVVGEATAVGEDACVGRHPADQAGGVVRLCYTSFGSVEASKALLNMFAGPS